MDSNSESTNKSSILLICDDGPLRVALTRWLTNLTKIDTRWVNLHSVLHFTDHEDLQNRPDIIFIYLASNTDRHARSALVGLEVFDMLLLRYAPKPPLMLLLSWHDTMALTNYLKERQQCESHTARWRWYDRLRIGIANALLPTIIRQLPDPFMNNNIDGWDEIRTALQNRWGTLTDQLVVVADEAAKDYLEEMNHSIRHAFGSSGDSYRPAVSWLLGAWASGTFNGHENEVTKLLESFAFDLNNNGRPIDSTTLWETERYRRLIMKVSQG